MAQNMRQNEAFDQQAQIARIIADEVVNNTRGASIPSTCFKAAKIIQRLIAAEPVNET